MCMAYWGFTGTGRSIRSKAPADFDESVRNLDRSHNPFDEVYGVSCLRENLTSISYGEGQETGHNDTAPVLYPTNIFQSVQIHAQIGQVPEFGDTFSQPVKW